MLVFVHVCVWRGEGRCGVANYTRYLKRANMHGGKEFVSVLKVRLADLISCSELGTVFV